ncbi:hypothetical protein [Tenacibaculum sp.]|uniref:hypothetical protein n=1 Tax=Tenacibaculum sp. TaxID=1906242 RepID=UPI003AA7BA15
MNKFLNKYFILSLFFFVQCHSVKDSVDILQKKATEKTIIRTASNNKNRIITIQFPNKITLQNNSFLDKEILTVDYKYNNIPPNRNLNLGLYVKEKGKLKRVRNNKKKIINSKGSLNFIFYSRHFVDSTKSIQQQFKPYVAKMLAENKDTLHIGTVTEFKKKYAALFEKLTKGDSISIQFLDNGKLGEYVTVPAKW